MIGNELRYFFRRLHLTRFVTAVLKELAGFRLPTRAWPSETHLWQPEARLPGALERPVAYGGGSKTVCAGGFALVRPASLGSMTL
jgi:hypothetical protein